VRREVSLTCSSNHFSQVKNETFLGFLAFLRHLAPMNSIVISLVALASFTTAGYTQTINEAGSVSAERRAAIEVGRELRHEGLSLGQAEIEIWKVAWERYPGLATRASGFASVAVQAFEGKQSRTIRTI
jgi:hypothetical protein